MPRASADGRPTLKRRSGRDVWHIYRRADGRAQWISTGTGDESEARRILADFEADLNRAGPVVTVADALDAYLADREGKVMALKRLHEAAKPLRDELGDLRLDQINATRIRRYREDRGVAPGTLQREENTLKAALNLAGHKVQWAPPKGQRTRERFLTREEGQLLIASAVEPHVRLFILLALTTGARKGAILDLTWDRVSFDPPRVDYNVPGRAITVKRRGIVPFGPQVAEALETARQLAVTDSVIEYAGKRVTVLQGGFRAAVGRAKLGSDVTPHVLKHTCVSWLASAGIPLEQARDLTATDERTLIRVYRKFDPNYLQDAVNVLDEMVSVTSVTVSKSGVITK